MPQHFTKDPAAVLDYYVDWEDWLAEGETISSSDWTLPDGITEDSSTHNDTKAEIWLSAGSPGKKYRLTNHIVTTDEREDERTITIEVQNR